MTKAYLCLTLSSTNSVDYYEMLYSSFEDKMLNRVLQSSDGKDQIWTKLHYAAQFSDAAKALVHPYFFSTLISIQPTFSCDLPLLSSTTGKNIELNLV